ncbi:hypothetical protein K470DRAFT_254290 [Piedraia hortae CBS 480.64]|uniref:YCII-related domain-containing protein n=1 Tax=Piedraia hortae CBS 480.64 TaxID=1314780 RepID=A0A6A7C8S7_9PEZI|nr:hypothetical protein K470DRAFT_254290 [Piedraia hortae CBS 480.64]
MASTVTSTLLRRTISSTTIRRTMSGSASSKQEWLILLPDKPGILSERMRVRPDHLKNIKSDVENGVLVFGGAMLEEPVKEEEDMKIKGSVMLVKADTKEEALKWVQKDVYSKSGVWDESKVEIIPFKSAIRKEM